MVAIPPPRLGIWMSKRLAKRLPGTSVGLPIFASMPDVGQEEYRDLKPRTLSAAQRQTARATAWPAVLTGSAGTSAELPDRYLKDPSHSYGLPPGRRRAALHGSRRPAAPGRAGPPDPAT